MWENYKVMTKCLSRFFLYLDQYFVRRRNIPSLGDLAILSFRDLVSMLSLSLLHTMVPRLCSSHASLFGITLPCQAKAKLNFTFILNIRFAISCMVTSEMLQFPWYVEMLY